MKDADCVPTSRAGLRRLWSAFMRLVMAGAKARLEPEAETGSLRDSLDIPVRWRVYGAASTHIRGRS